MTKAERDFFEAARVFAKWGVYDAEARFLDAYRALLAEEEKHAVGDRPDDLRVQDTALDAAAGSVASSPIAEPGRCGHGYTRAEHPEKCNDPACGAEPKGGVEECLAFVRSNLLWNYRDGHRNFAEGAILALDEALRLYREERDARK